MKTASWVEEQELVLDAQSPTGHAGGFIESYVMVSVAFGFDFRVGIDRDIEKGI
jgi:hypothetical protein